MRKPTHYKFRGLNAVKQWHVGYLEMSSKTASNTCWIKHHGGTYYVYKNTIGQEIGIQDVNKQNIFEGDIVKLNNTLYTIVYKQEICAFVLQYIKSEAYLPIVNTLRLEVVGNIYENTELLN